MFSLTYFWRDWNVNEPGHEKMCLMPYAKNKGADQPAHLRSLISAFVVRCLDSIISLDSIAEISRLASFCGCAGRFVSGLVGNSWRHVLSCHGSNAYLKNTVPFSQHCFHIAPGERIIVFQVATNKNNIYSLKWTNVINNMIICWTCPTPDFSLLYFSL